MKQAFVIPVYNHGNTLENVVSALEQYKLPILVVDDGNDEENKKYISLVSQNYKSVTVITNKRNRGKGYSICKAVKEAHKMGITHLFQIDADGQHDTQSTCANFLEESKSHPEALICGYPEFDASLPAARAKAKKISNGYTEFLAFEKVKDSMCGYRIYPVEPFYKICTRAWIDSHMGFDSEILIRMIWAGVPVIYKAVRVTYPVGGKSNFRVVRDNIHISFMFTRLTIGMWLRYPWLKARQIKRRKQNSPQENSWQEEGQ